MNLTFNKDSNGAWVAQFEVSDAFSIHIEKGSDGPLSILQTSVLGGKSDNVPSLYMSVVDEVMDKIIPVVPFPVTLTIVAYTKEAPYAVISSEGDVLDITNVLNTPV